MSQKYSGTITETGTGRSNLAPDLTGYRSEGFALTGYDIPGCMEDGAWMLWENSSAAVAAVAHPDLGNGQFSSFVTESELPECADRSVSSKRVPPAQFLRKVVTK